MENFCRLGDVCWWDFRSFVWFCFQRISLFSFVRLLSFSGLLLQVGLPSLTIFSLVCFCLLACIRRLVLPAWLLSLARLPSHTFALCCDLLFSLPSLTSLPFFTLDILPTQLFSLTTVWLLSLCLCSFTRLLLLTEVTFQC